MTYPTEHLMNLAALAHATTDPDELLRLLRAGHQLYHQSLAETRTAVTVEHQDRPKTAPLTQCRAQQLSLPPDATRADALAAEATPASQPMPGSAGSCTPATPSTTTAPLTGTPPCRVFCAPWRPQSRTT